MSSTSCTAHRRDFCRALYLRPSDKKFGAVINKFTHSIYFVLKITGSM